MPPKPDDADFAELAGGFIHEVKNHVSTLALNLSLLAENFANPQTPRERKALERVGKLQVQTRRLVELSNDFLNYARAETLQLEPTSMDDTVSDMVDFFLPTAKQAGIGMIWYPSGSGRSMMLDRNLFKNVLLNLMIDAREAMPEGGELILQGSTRPTEVVLDIIDTGCGIPQEKLQDIFIPFHTTKKGGSGLGLPTARKIIRAHGGEIDVISEPGRGAKFTIRIPKMKENPSTEVHTNTEPMA